MIMNLVLMLLVIISLVVGVIATSPSLVFAAGGICGMSALILALD